MIGSVCGKKKRKAIKLHKSDLHNDVIQKDENALSFLSSLVDILLLKKDIENRYSGVSSDFIFYFIIFFNSGLCGLLVIKV